MSDHVRTVTRRRLLQGAGAAGVAAGLGSVLAGGQAQAAALPFTPRGRLRPADYAVAYAPWKNPGTAALLTGHALTGPITIGDIDVTFTDMPHGGITSAGYIFSSNGTKVGYATDFQRITGEMQVRFRSLDVLVIDALRRKPHPTHPHLQLTLDFIEKGKPKRAVLMHMDSSMDYSALASELPDGVEPGYDGLEMLS